MKILIIDDDEAICGALKELLDSNGYEGIIGKDFTKIVEQIKELKIDLILLDINIPLIDGKKLLQEIRKVSDVAVIMVTSSNLEIDEALSISYGADDYISKPYNPNILLLRIGAVLRRVKNDYKEKEELIYKDLKFDIEKGTIKRANREIELTKNEMIIFSYLLRHQNKIVTRDELMTAIWDTAEYINDNSLSVNINRLRNKLKEIGYPDVIDTRKGMGYILL